MDWKKDVPALVAVAGAETGRGAGNDAGEDLGGTAGEDEKGCGGELGEAGKDGGAVGGASLASTGGRVIRSPD